MIIITKTNKIFFRLLLVGMLSILFVLSIFSQEVKRMQIGSLHGWFADKGCEIEEGRVGVQQDGTAWPAYYQKQDCQAAKGFWIGCTNFTDATGKNYSNKVVCCGPRLWGNGEFFAKTFTMTAKFQPPKVFVDNVLETSIVNYVNDEDPTLLPDRVITNVVNTAIGIEMTRKIIAFSQQDNDNYFIYDYTFKNTGDVLGDGSKILNQTLTGVYFYWQYRYAAAYEGCEYIADPPRWGINGVIATRGDGSYSAGTDEDLRCQYEYHGKYSKVTFDNIGGPYIQRGVAPASTEPFNGHLAAAQYVGVVTIHADKSATDISDDITQPSTTSYEGSDDDNNKSDISDQFNLTKMQSRYGWMSKGHRLPRYSNLVGSGYADAYGGSGGMSVANGYGPYDLKFGESIHIVMAEGVSGLSRDLCYLYGSQWYAKTMTDAAKDAFVSTGADSLINTFRRAIDNYKKGYKIPQPPQPPSKFEIISGGDKITLKWANPVVNDPPVAGYRIYRADSTWDNRKYKLIFECGNNVNTFEDKTPVRGYSYYYYIQSIGNDALVSNRQYTQIYDPAYLKRKADAALEHIRVVPNPYNLKAQNYQYVGERDKIMFLNIPGQCTIKIYTERGDLIYTINHNDGSGDASWNSITSSTQTVVSGVYIAYFETPTGESTFRKFVIIR